MKKILTLFIILYNLPALGMEPAAKEQDSSAIASLVDQLPQGPLPVEISKHIQSYCELPLETDYYFSHGWAFSQDKSIALFLNDNVLKIYDFATKKVKIKNKVRQCIVSPDSQKIFILFDNKRGELIDLCSNKTMFTKPNVAWGAQFSPDSKKIYIKFNDKHSELVDLSSNLTSLTRHNAWMCNFSPDGQWVFLRYWDSPAELIDLRLNQTVFKRHHVSSGQFSPDSQKIFIRLFDRTAQLIDLRTNQPVAQVTNVCGGQFTSNSQKMFIRFNDQKARLIDLISDQTFLLKENVADFALSPDKQKVFITFKDQAAELIDLQSNKMFFTKENITSGPLFSPDSQKIYIGLEDKLTSLKKAELIDIRSNTSIELKEATISDLIDHTPQLNDLTITQALYLRAVHNRLLNKKACNNDAHGTMVYNSFPEHIRLLIDAKIEAVHEKN